MLCITHDVGQTLDFDRVLVLEGGRIVQAGHPKEVAAAPASQFRQLMNSEADVRGGTWSSRQWRRLVLDDGRLTERPSHAQPASFVEPSAEAPVSTVQRSPLP